MLRSKVAGAAAVALAAVLLAAPARAEEKESEKASEGVSWRVGFAGRFETSQGIPSNDILGGEIHLGYRFRPEWWVRLHAARSKFDFEKPIELIPGHANVETADTTPEIFGLGLTVEWHPLEPGGRLDAYVAAGVGGVKVGDDKAREPGPPLVDVETRGGLGSELHVEVGASVRIVGQLHFTLAARATYLYVDLEVRDRQTGDKALITSFDAYGLLVGFDYRF